MLGNKYSLDDWLIKTFIILFVIIIILLGLVYTQIKQEGAKCVMNPLVYGVKQYSEGFACSCSTGKAGSPFLYVTRENATLINPIIGGGLKLE